jgi:ABC-type antimicrobial peptide transport system permease subunit
MRGAFANPIAGGLRMLPQQIDPDTVFRELITGESLIENSRSDILTMSAVGGVEPLVYSAAAATSFLVAVLAGIPSARRAAAVQPMVAMRTE